MAAGKGKKIESIDFRSIKKKVDLILGVGSGDNGYGQVITSPTVNRGDIIGVDEWIALRNDMVKIRQHQIGGTVGTSTATDNKNLVNITSGTVITEAIRNQYDRFSNALIINKFYVHSTQLTTNTIVSGLRTTSWAGTITHNITVTGSTSGTGSSQNMRYFFNAGGQIIFDAARSGGIASSKNTKWTQFLAGVGALYFGHHGTIKSSGNGTVYPVGFYHLTTSNKLIFQVSSNGINRYHSLAWKIYARTDSTKSQVIFTIQYIDTDTSSDHDPGDNFAKNITGNLVSNVYERRPTGSNVSVYGITATHSGLTDGIAPERYRTFTTVTTANEGAVLQYTVECSNPGAKTLTWETIGNVNSKDFQDNLLSGTVTLNNDGNATITRQIAADYVTEGKEQFYIRIKSGSSVVASSKALTINDTTVYSMSVSATSVNEGSSISFTINSSTKAIGNVVYIRLVGNISDADIVGGLYRTLTFTSSSITSTITIANDIPNDIDEGFVIQVRSGSYSGPILLQSKNIYIFDTSPTYSITMTGSTHTVTTYGNKVFSSPGSYAWTVPQWVSSVNVAIYGGGGGAGGGKWTGWYGGYIGSGGPGTNGEVKNYTINVLPGYALIGTIGEGGVGGYGYGWGVGGNGTATSLTYTANGSQYTANGGVGGCWGCLPEGSPGPFSAPAQTYGHGGSFVSSAYGTSHPGTAGAVVLSWTSNQIVNDTFVNAAEGNTINFVVHTTHVTNGTKIYYNPIGNISETDFVGGIYGRSMTINNNVGSGSLTIAQDNISEGTETFNIQLRIGSSTGTIVETSQAIDISPGGNIVFGNIGTTSWTVPTGVTKITVTLVGGGGGGGTSSGDDSGWSGGGGGSGGVYKATYTVPANAVLSISVGAGGSAKNSGGPSSLYVNGTKYASVVGGSGGTSRYGGAAGPGGNRGANGVWADDDNTYAVGGVGGTNYTGYGEGGAGAIFYSHGYVGKSGSQGVVMISW